MTQRGAGSRGREEGGIVEAGGGAFGAYSETSHGTLGQPPLGHADSHGYNTFAAVGAGAGAALCEERRRIEGMSSSGTARPCDVD